MDLTSHDKVDAVRDDFNFPEVDLMNAVPGRKKAYFVVFVAVWNSGFSRHGRQVEELRVSTFQVIDFVVKSDQVPLL